MSDKTKSSSSTSSNGITEEKKQPAPPADKPSTPAPADTEKTTEPKPSAPAKAEVKKETTPLPIPETVQAEKPAEAENIVKPQPKAPAQSKSIPEEDEPLAQEITPPVQDEPALATPTSTPSPSEIPAPELEKKILEQEQEQKPDEKKLVSPLSEEKPVSALAKEKTEEEIMPPAPPALPVLNKIEGNKVEVPVRKTLKKPIKEPDKTRPTPKQPPVPKTKQPTPAKAKPSSEPFIIKYSKKLAEQLRKANIKRQQKVQTNLNKIMEYALKTQKVTNNDVERITGVGDVQAYRYLKKLVKQGKLIRFGKKKNTFYKPIKK